VPLLDDELLLVVFADEMFSTVFNDIYESSPFSRAALVLGPIIPSTVKPANF